MNILALTFFKIFMGSICHKTLFASGSCDSLTKLWDIRSGKNVMTFRGHETDVNSVTFFPDGNFLFVLYKLFDL